MAGSLHSHQVLLKLSRQKDSIFFKAFHSFPKQFKAFLVFWNSRIFQDWTWIQGWRRNPGQKTQHRLYAFAYICRNNVHNILCMVHVHRKICYTYCLIFGDQLVFLVKHSITGSFLLCQHLQHQNRILHRFLITGLSSCIDTVGRVTGSVSSM